jgi:isochorismate synthase
MAKSFVLFRYPNEKLFKLIESKPLESHSLAFIESLKKQYFVAAPFQVDSKTVFLAFPADNIQSLSEEEILKKDFDFSSNKTFGLHESREKEYLEKVTIQRCKIRNGSYDKIVLSRVKKIKNDFESIQSYPLALADRYPNAFVYLMQLPNGQTWCGASPETLARYKKGVFSTMALAGTQMHAEKEVSEVKWDKKDISEQKWVQKAIIDCFENQSIPYKKSKTSTASAGHLVHILTEFKAKCNQEQAAKLIADLHPSPAVCGTPTNETRQEILRFEEHNRFYYTGYLGLFKPDNFHLFVNLRCMLIELNSCYIFIGGGITKESDPEKEWEETENKAHILEIALKKNEIAAVD